MPTVTLPAWGKILLLVALAAATALNHAHIFPPEAIASHVISAIVEFVATLAVLFGVRTTTAPPAAGSREAALVTLAALRMLDRGVLARAMIEQPPADRAALASSLRELAAIVEPSGIRLPPDKS